MRIIGGQHQRRLIHPPPSLPVRPTTDKAKEALFNILNNHFDFEDLQVLDLFAGTGSISFEFASRGASEVVAVDNDPGCYRFIRQVKEQLDLDNLVPVRADAFRYLSACSRGFDLIFADPPYEMAEITRIPDEVFNGKLLAEGGWLIIEHGAPTSFDDHPFFIRKKRYSKVHFSFFETSG